MPRVPLYLQTLLGMFLGIAAGLYFGKSTADLGVVSKFVIEVIKTAAIPLLFFSILDGMLNAELRGRSFISMCFVYSINAVFAVSIALVLSNYFEPGKYLSLVFDAVSLEKFNLHHSVGMGEFFSELKNPGQFTKSSKPMSLFSGTTAAIMLSMCFGIILLVVQRLKVPYHTVILFRTRKTNQLVLKWLFWVIEGLTHLIPLAVFCAVAKIVGTTGFGFVGGLIAYFVSCASGMLIHIFFVYQFWILISGRKLREFWTQSKEALVHSFGINSSLATLPMTLNTLKKLNVSEGSARMAACVGTNFNNDGILLYEVVAALFMVQAYGLSLAVPDQLWLSVVCILATIGVGGIPEAGMISLAIVLTAIGLPTQDLPALLTVDWVLGRMRSVTNVVGDLSGAISLDLIKKKTE